MSETAKISQGPGKYALATFNLPGCINTSPGLFQKPFVVNSRHLSEVESEMMGLGVKLVKETTDSKRRLPEKLPIEICHDNVLVTSDTRMERACKGVLFQANNSPSGFPIRTNGRLFIIDTRNQ
jgi:hypothetical protein